jgi:molecular chaperone GrpE
MSSNLSFNDSTENAATEEPVEHEALPEPDACDDGAAMASLSETAPSEEEISRLSAENSDLNDRLLRALADFENFKRRSRQQMLEQRQFANERLITDLLPALDHFELALAASEENGDLQSWKAGVELIARQIAEVLSRHGVQTVESVNTPFDPARHEAIARVETADVPEGCIVELVQKGYLLHDRLLRPARVRVAAQPVADETASLGPGSGQSLE